MYALLPSIGAALMAGGVAAVAQRKDPRRVLHVAGVLLLAVIVLIPVYRIRNRRWVLPAELSRHVMATLRDDLQREVPGRVVLIDDAAERFNLATAFGNLLPEALRLHIGAGWTGEIVPADAPISADHAEVYRLVKGRLAREP